MSAEQNAASRGLGRLLTRVAPIEPQEVPAVVAAFCLFFCVFAGYFAVRPVRETMGTILGKERVADLFVVTWVASLAIIPIYGVLVAKFRRSLFLPWIYGSIAVALAVVGLVLRHGRQERLHRAVLLRLHQRAEPVHRVGVLELPARAVHQQPEQAAVRHHRRGRHRGRARRARSSPTCWSKQVGNSGILFFGAFMFVLAIVFQRALLAIWKKDDTVEAARRRPAAAAAARRVRGDRPIGGNPFAGFTMVLTSPYLLAIALFVFLLASVSTFLYFEQLRLVEQLFSDPADRTRVFARLDWIVQSLTVVCQVFLTGRIASKPRAHGAADHRAGRDGRSASSRWRPPARSWCWRSCSCCRRVGEYAFVRPAREMLFSRLDNETKYKAKNVIDVPVYRGADARDRRRCRR